MEFYCRAVVGKATAGCELSEYKAAPGSGAQIKSGRSTNGHFFQAF
jgi:hypothetical protein